MIERGRFGSQAGIAGSQALDCQYESEHRQMVFRPAFEYGIYGRQVKNRKNRHPDAAYVVVRRVQWRSQQQSQ
jgi:hypothetical protein